LRLATFRLWPGLKKSTGERAFFRPKPRRAYLRPLIPP